ncbi:carbon-nitrogen hydrolase [Streptomyces sp. Lzd4kr]|nr:carbon-nitrogen hydrolase [Streptomyces sp. Lzd4kr]
MVGEETDSSLQPLRYALLQDAPALGDKRQNLATAAGTTQRLRGLVDVVVFPEMFLTGYALDPKLPQLAEDADGPSLRRLRAFAALNHTAIICGFPERTPHGLYNSVVVIDRDGRQVGIYRKTHLFGDEPRYFLPGRRLSVFRTSLGPVGVLVCYDLEFPEPARVLALRGARLLAVPTANMYPYAFHHAVYARARAMENGVGVLIANQVGRVGALRMAGGSRAITPEGEVCAASEDASEVLTGEIRLPSEPSDDALRYLRHRRADLYGILTAGDQQGTEPE